MNGGIIGDPEKVGVDRAGLEAAIKLLEEQRANGLHNGAQLFVARKGQVLVDVAIGEAVPGAPMRTDSVLFWASATKPLTALALAQLMERGKLKLDDRVQKFIPQFANGKEACTIKHVLTHTGGFPMGGFPFLDYTPEEMIQKICETPAEWEPGTAAAYHGQSGWQVLGEIVHRVDGRPIEVYLEQEVLKPLGMKDTSLGLSDKRAAELGNRLSLLAAKGGTDEKAVAAQLVWNEPRVRRLPLPSAAGFGPAHDIGRFYLALWNGGEWEGARIVKKESVALFTATHRKGMPDRIASKMVGREVSPPWGLGFFKGYGDGTGIEFGRQSTAAAFGHAGAGVGVAFCEPSRDLVVVNGTNGRLPSDIDNIRRLRAVSDILHSACH